MPREYTARRKEICAASYRRKHPYTPPPDLPDERWLPVVGYEALYEVSDLGRVRRLGITSGAQPGRILKPEVQRNGYAYVTLCVANRARTFRLHRVVAIAFLGEAPDGAPEINHKDGAKTNNRADNMEWVSRSQNQRHAIVTGLQKVKHHTRSAPLGKLRAL